MRLATIWLAVVGCGGSVTIGESDPTDDTETTDETDVEPDPPANYEESGESTANTDAGSSNVGDRCTLEWTRYRPDGEPGEVLVILVHGFARDQSKMAGWATHLASWGAEVVTPDMCFLGAFNTDHEANGRHVAKLAFELADGRPVILAGHSAGGLAATLGAAETDAAGVLLLDPVDNDDLGLNAIGKVSATVGGLYGESNACNGNNNGIAMAVKAPDDRLFRVETADHCHFESPTDRACTGFCRRGQADDDAIDATIAGMAASFVMWKGGLDDDGETWWTAGSQAQQALPATLLPLP